MLGEMTVLSPFLQDEELGSFLTTLLKKGLPQTPS